MQQQWRNTCEKFLQLTSREQFLLLLTGVVAIFFVISYFFIEQKSAQVIGFDRKSQEITLSNQTLNFSITEYQSALEQDPDEETRKKITQLEAKLGKIDEQLVHLTTELISPSEMRQALLKLLNLEPGVSLLSFELTGAKPLLALAQQPSNAITEQASKNKASTAEPISTEEPVGLNLYQHGIKIKLSGEYFQLRNYLQRLEQLSWKFFWQDFQFEVKEYPNSEVDITIYSLGLTKEFIGV